MRRRPHRPEILGMNATRYRHHNTPMRKRMIEFVFSFAFIMSVMAAVVGTLAIHANSHLSCTVHSIATMSDTCSKR
jgi:hypothetical protein